MINYIIWAMIVILYTPLFFNLYRSEWKAFDYTHAYFILPVFFWLIWRKRTTLKEAIQKSRLDHNLMGFFGFLVGILLFIFGWRQQYSFITTLSLLPVLLGLTTYLYGFQATRIVLFPLLYLLLLVPIPIGIVDDLTLPMRYGLSVMTEIILGFFHFPISREGLLLTIGESELFMGQPCSGFRSIITMFSLSLVYVYLSRSSLFRKTILVSSIVPFAVLGNLIRIIALCLITYYFGEETGQGFFHSFSGIVIFVFIVSGLIGLEFMLERCAR
ncbi:MAG: hypothetical protein DCC43_02850 [Candidatus Brocadia sp.]|jgi:exosortase|uniref:Exosortase n=1 Tax=Candidatus Brocadia fulgida TaxID=380242 RepID=A0A0M2USW1_9BACT|nr:MAG: putative exosortase [Candidatus Brocadia fulgida]MCC6326535.1 exosortase [Candidatus Brocadia sp.]MCE7910457.1 exosortase [Candidatus Brocadia sp. AMX3]OQY97370.1 MAG: hypothetical protein B6D35_15325 [Candidatus Brocadia sp. UTAMX2]MBV6519477.1 hypothetical protein [Candidatus Brocadia fulgida]